MDMRRVLITGCAGFIGGHMTERLLNEGYAVTGVDDFSTGDRRNIASFVDRIRFVEGDLAEPAVAAEAVRDVSHIVHLASIPSVPRSVSNPLENMRSSVASTVSLLTAASEAGARRVVLASSSAVYGDGEELPKREDMNVRPLSPYAAAKAATECYGMAFSASRGLDCVSVRYFNVFGQRQDPNGEYAAVIPKFLTLMLAGKAPTIFGDGGQSRDFIHVSDVVAGNLAALFHPEPLNGEAFNIAGGARIDLLELVAAINSLLGTNIEPRHAPERPGEVRHSVADIGKAKRVLGFSPALNFAAGLEQTAVFFREKGE